MTGPHLSGEASAKAPANRYQRQRLVQGSCLLGKVGLALFQAPQGAAADAGPVCYLLKLIDEPAGAAVGQHAPCLVIH